MKNKLTIAISSAITGGVVAEFTQCLITEKWQFIAVLLVVLSDAFFGIWKAIKFGSFETNKAFKFIYMLVAFWLLLAVTLSMEKGFPFASFLSEAVMFPILTFQIISIVKNLHLLGIVSGSLLEKILANIDKHKEV